MFLKTFVFIIGHIGVKTKTRHQIRVNMKQEKQLIKQCIQGKRQAQQQLYQLHSQQLYVVALRYAQNQADAEDILQEAFIKIFTNLAQFRKDCPLFQWMKRILINTALNHNRSKLYLYPVKDVNEMEEYLSTEQVNLSQYSLDELLQMVQTLPTRCQVVFNLYAIEGYKHQEIAQMLSISEGTSKSQYSRAKSLLQDMIKEEKLFYGKGIKQQIQL